MQQQKFEYMTVFATINLWITCGIEIVLVLGREMSLYIIAGNPTMTDVELPIVCLVSR